MNRPQGRNHRRTRRLGLEHLEKRALLSTFTWVSDVDGSFLDPSKWRDQNGNSGVPGPSDNAQIGFGNITVTVPSSVAVNSLSDSATLHIETGATLTLANAAASSTIGPLILDNGGTLQMNGGVTTLNATSTITGAFNVAPSATLDIGGPVQADSGTTFLGSGLYDVAGTLDINANLSGPANLELDSGSINTATSSVVFSSAGVVNWFGGGIGGNGTFQVAGKGALNLVGNNAKSMNDSAILKIDASASVLDSGLGALVGSGLEIDNFGTWTLTNDANLTDGSLSFNNYGTFTKTTDGQGHGVGTTTVDLNTFNNFNGGTVDSKTGTLSFFSQTTSQDSGAFDAEANAFIAFGSGSVTLNAGTTMIGAGDFLIQNLNNIGGITVTVDFGVSVAPPNLNLDSGTLNVLGTVNVTANGTWTGGTITGAGSVNFPAKSTLNITGSAEKDLAGSTINNAGFAIWTGTGAIVGNNGSVINNSGTFTASSDNTFGFSGGTEVSFNNSGTFTKSSPTGSGATTFNVNVLNNSGTVNVNSGTLSLETGSATQVESGTFNVASGATLDLAESQLANATTQLNAGAKFQGAGLVELDNGDLTVNAPVSVPNFTLTGGTQNGPSTLTVTGAFNWTGGDLDGSGATTVAPGATLSLTGSNSKNLTNDHVLNNQGTGTWTGTGEFDGNVNPTFNNSGTFTAASDTNFNGNGGGGFVFNNSGTFTKTSQSATGTTLIIFNLLNNAGTVDVNSGILSLNGTGTESGLFNVAMGATLDFSATAINDIAGGTLQLNAGTKFQGTGLYEQDGGTLSVNAPLSAPANFTMTGGTLAVPATFNSTGVFNWSGGTINGSGSVKIPSGVHFNIVGASQKTLDLSTTSNAGLVVWTGQGEIFSHGGAVIKNLAGGVFDAQNDEPLDVTFNNSGTFTKTSATGTGTTAISSVLNNLAGGVVDVVSGTLAANNVTNGGTISLAPATTLNVFTSNFSGGNFTQTAAGTLAIQVGGAPATGLFGQVTVAGSASLNGTLNVTLVNGFAPTTGQVFPILTYGTNTGDFTTKNLPTTTGAPIFSTSRKATEYDLNAIVTVQAAAVQTTDFDGDGKSDFGVFRVSTAQWLVALSSGGLLTPAPSFGATNLSDIPAPGDYDGVGHTELAVFRPSTGQWLINGPNGLEVKSFGATNLFDIPVPGDYDGVGHTELAVFRPSTGQWLINGPNGVEVKSFGATNLFDIPVPGDYDGVGHTELAVFRPSTGQWLINGPNGVEIKSFGATNLVDLPVPGDYTGSGKTELAVFRPSTAQWIIQTPGGGTLMPTFGAPNLFDVPLNPVDAALIALGKVQAASVPTIQASSVSVAPTSSPAVVIAPAEAPAQKSSRATQDIWLLAVEQLALDGL